MVQDVGWKKPSFEAGKKSLRPIVSSARHNWTFARIITVAIESRDQFVISCLGLEIRVRFLWDYNILFAGAELFMQEYLLVAPQVYGVDQYVYLELVIVMYGTLILNTLSYVLFDFISVCYFAIYCFHGYLFSKL